MTLPGPSHQARLPEFTNILQLVSVVNRRLRSSILPFAVGTVVSKGMDRLSTFLSNPVVKKK